MANEGQEITQVPESYGGPATNVQESGEVHPSTPPTTINTPLSRLAIFLFSCSSKFYLTSPLTRYLFKEINHVGP